MGVYRKFKDKDPRKFLERFSKNLPPSPSKEEPPAPVKKRKTPEIKEVETYTTPAPRAAMDYATLEKKCQELLLGMIEEEEFRKIISNDKNRLEKFGKGFDNFKFNTKGLSWERELQIKNLFIKSVKEYGEGLSSFEQYLISKKKSFMKRGLKLITTAGKRLAFIKLLSDKDKKIIIEGMKKYIARLSRREKKPSVEPSSFEAPEEKESPARDKEKILSPPPILPSGDEGSIKGTSFAPSVRENVEFTPASVPSKDREEEEIDPNVLLAFSIFRDMEFTRLEEIGKSMKRETYIKDSVIYHEGMDAGKVYIILSGEVLLYKSMPLNPDKFEIIDYASPGDIIGDMGAVDNGPHSTNAKAVSGEVKLSYITREDFQSFLARYPGLSNNLNKIYCTRLREAFQRLVH